MERNGRVGRRVREGMLSTAAVGALVITLVSFDGRVGREMAGIVRGAPSAEFSRAAIKVRENGRSLADRARDETIEHPSFALFVAGAVVLLFSLTRT